MVSPFVVLGTIFVVLGTNASNFVVLGTRGKLVVLGTARFREIPAVEVVDKSVGRFVVPGTQTRHSRNRDSSFSEPKFVVLGTEGRIVSMKYRVKPNSYRFYEIA